MAVYERDAAAEGGYRDGVGEEATVGGYDGWLAVRTTFFGGIAGANRGLSALPSRASSIDL
ncbi:MAG: hypothetical protein M3P04_02475 [Actinomycetota bacterium]|nr:hypothetical protein [Actinomycetota bacterium]